MCGGRINQLREETGKISSILPGARGRMLQSKVSDELIATSIMRVHLTLQLVIRRVDLADCACVDLLAAAAPFDHHDTTDGGTDAEMPLSIHVKQKLRKTPRRQIELSRYLFFISSEFTFRHVRRF